MNINHFKSNNIVHFSDGFNIPSRYNDIVEDMKYHYYNTNVEWQLRLHYTYYSEAMRRLKKLGYLTDSQFKSLNDLNCKLYRERLQY